MCSTWPILFVWVAFLPFLLVNKLHVCVVFPCILHSFRGRLCFYTTWSFILVRASLILTSAILDYQAFHPLITSGAPPTCFPDTRRGSIDSLQGVPPTHNGSETSMSMNMCHWWISQHTFLSMKVARAIASVCVFFRLAVNV